MPQIIICCRGNPRFHAFKRRDFHWDESFQLYVWQKKVFTDLDEFHRTVEKVLAANTDLQPSIRLLPEPTKAEDLLPETTPFPVPNLTLEQALEIVREKAPDLLKKKSGPKPVAA